MKLAEEINEWFMSRLAVAEVPSRSALVSKTVELTLERAAQEAEKRLGVRECTECDDARDIADAIRKLKG